MEVDSWYPDIRIRMAYTDGGSEHFSIFFR